MDRSLTRKFYNDHKAKLDLLKGHDTSSNFTVAVGLLFGDKPAPGKIVRVGRVYLRYSGFKREQVSFLPQPWFEKLDKGKSLWKGCENWWAGYPLVVFVEMRTDAVEKTGKLNLVAEVGPISDHNIRKGLIKTIKSASVSQGMDRIAFPAGSEDKGRLYSRFLRNNSCPVQSIHNLDEIERAIAKLISGFEEEFDLVARAIDQFIEGTIE